jgi:hypothetical protein
MGAGCGGPACILVIPIAGLAAVVGAVVGGIHGGTTATSRTLVVEANAALREAASELDVNEVLSDRVSDFAREHTSHHVVTPPGNVRSSPGAAQGYGALTTAGVDTVVEVGVQGLLLSGPWEANPELALVLAARARVIRALDNAIVHQQTFRYQSPSRRFTEWAADAAQRFRFWLEYGLKELSEQIAREVFLFQPAQETVRP